MTNWVGLGEGEQEGAKRNYRGNKYVYYVSDGTTVHTYMKLYFTLLVSAV